jgi:hypothetical protein
MEYVIVGLLNIYCIGRLIQIHANGGNANIRVLLIPLITIVLLIKELI